MIAVLRDSFGEMPMSAVPKKLYTAEEYEARERVAEFKSEFYRGEIFPLQGSGSGPYAIAGAKFDHTRVKENLARQIGNRLECGPCQSLSSDMRVIIQATGLQTYPDVLIVCGTPKFVDDSRDCLLNPSVIFEVLSNSTASYDRGAKFRNYQLIPTLMEYILAEQDEPICERYVRAPDGFTWLRTTVEGIGASLTITTVDATIPMRDIYAGVEFSEPAGPGE